MFSALVYLNVGEALEGFTGKAYGIPRDMKQYGGTENKNNEKPYFKSWFKGKSLERAKSLTGKSQKRS